MGVKHSSGNSCSLIPNEKTQLGNFRELQWLNMPEKILNVVLIYFSPKFS